MTVENTPALNLPPLYFDPWLTASGAALINVSAEVFTLLPAPEITPGRKPRADAMHRRLLCLRSLLANLVALALQPGLHCALAVPLKGGRRSRYYRPPYHIAVLSDTLKDLQAAGMVSVVPGAARRTRTYVTPTPRLEAVLTGHGITLQDVGRLAGGETLLLRSSEPGDGEETFMEYVDTATTMAMRRDMEVINETINAADIRFAGAPIAPTHLVRMFQGDFQHHGRMYRGVWQSLPKRERHRLSINGEAVVDLDFSAMFLQLAYLKQGVEMPHGDPYAIPELSGCRGAVKRLISSLLARKAPALRLPPGIKEQLPEGWTMRRFEHAACLKHPAIAELFGKGLSLEFMFTESRVMVAVLLGLAAKGIVGLPMHDGLMVAASHKEAAIEMMQKVSFEVLGKALPVAEKTIS